jgi:phage gp36-like protein
MAYATVSDLIERFGQTEMVRLTTPADQDLDGIVMTVAEAKIEDASALIDSYVRKRYRTPMDVPPQEIVRACCILARYDLATGEQREPTEQMREQRSETMAWLRDIAAGKALLELDEVAPSDESYARESSRRPVYGRGGDWN